MDPIDESTVAAPVGSIASGRDEAGVPIHHGWAPLGSRRRWMEPFLLVLLVRRPGTGTRHRRLEEMGITERSGRRRPGLPDAARARAGRPGDVRLVDRSPGRAQRREYELTAAGYAALDEWAAVMKERARLIGEFDGRYLEWVARERRPRE